MISITIITVVTILISIAVITIAVIAGSWKPAFESVVMMWGRRTQSFKGYAGRARVLR